MADHPNAATVRLKDSNWHNLIAYRVVNSPLYRALSIYPASQSGCYIDEVLSTNKVIPVWKF